jgi:adenylate kinase
VPAASTPLHHSVAPRTKSSATPPSIGAEPTRNPSVECLELLRDHLTMEPTVALLGPPGSGKGTQAERLRERRGFVSLATGDLLREARLEGTGLGRRASQYMDRGDLVPDELIVAMVRDAIARLDAKPILLDGFPRTVAQADALADALEARGRRLTAAVLVDVPDDVVVERISGRRQGRADDRPETVRERLRVYHRATEPLIAYYDERGLLRRVDGSRDADAVAEGVRAAIR